MHRSQLFLRLCSLAALVGLSSAASGQVVISQVYGGAGSAGATYNGDYVELFNRGPIAVDVSTWSLQYASATGNSWGKTNLTGSIAAGGYYLVYQGSGTGTSPLPVAADATGATQMSATVGKVALVANQTLLGTNFYFAPGQNGIVDFVGYGAATSGNIYGWEGSGPTGTNLSTTTAVFRKNGGCTDTNDNAADFDAPSAPLPRNSATPHISCASVNPSGACCLSNGTCQYLTSTACGGLSGSYVGDFVPCAQGTYTVSNTSAALLDISTTGTLQPSGGTAQITAAAALPFPFTYFGQTFNSFRATNNGWMTLCQTYGSSQAVNTALPTASAPVCTIAPLWDAFTTATTTTGKLYVQTLGTTPTRQFIVQWQLVPPQTGGGTVDKNTFQVIFNESSQIIEFRYGTIVPNAGLYTGGTITASFNTGLEDFSGAVGVDILPGLLGNGGPAAAQQFAPTGQCPITGSCCRQGTCFVTTSHGCTVGSGAYAGDATTCGATDCTAGACCKPNGTCAELLIPTQCASMNGLYQGDNAVCSAVTCPTTGSCCVGITCSIAFQSICTTAGGTWTSGGSCTPNNCAGSCCNTTTNVCALATDMTACGTANTFFSAGTTCTTNPCPAPVNDACTGALVYPVSSLGTTVLGGNGSATGETGTYATCTISTTSFGVWYTFTPAETKGYLVSTCSALTIGNTSMRVFSLPVGGVCTTQLACVGGNANDTTCGSNIAAAVNFCGIAGQTYYILITADSGLTGQFGLTISDNATPCAVASSCCNNTTAACVVTDAVTCPTGYTIGAGTACDASACNIVRGACCQQSGACTLTSASGCDITNAIQTFLGVNTACPAGLCWAEIEPNSVSFADQATNNMAVLNNGDVLSGLASGGSFGAGNGTALVDMWLVKTAAAAPGIYRHEMSQTQGATTQNWTVRGRGQTSGVAAASPGNNGAQQSVSSAARTLAWYGFGKQEQVTLETASGSTTIPYVYKLTDTIITPTEATGTLYEGAVTIQIADSGATGIDSDCWLYDSNFNAVISGAGGPGGADGTLAPDGSLITTSTLPITTSFTRALTPGIYYLAVSPANLANDQPNVAAEGIISGSQNLMNFADAVLCNSMNSTVAYAATVQLADSASNTVTSPVVAWPVGSYGLVNFVKFTVVGISTGSCCVTDGSCTVTTSAGCSAAWTNGGVCIPNTCPLPPSGVCCRGATCTTAYPNAVDCGANTTTASTGGLGWAFISTATVCNAGVNPDGSYSGSLTSTTSPCCFANYNHSAGLEVQDIFDFLNDWFAGRAIAIPGGDGVSTTGLAVQNIFNFLNAWFAGGCI